MASKKQIKANQSGFPIDDRPIIFTLNDNDFINYIGRYIETEGIFMLSLNDEGSEFVHQDDVEKWVYVNEHPTIISETLNGKKKSVKKKSKDVPEESVMDIPPFIADFINHIHKQMGINYDSVQVRVVGIDDLNHLPKPVLEQLLEKAVQDENFELASKVRDALKSAGNDESN